MKDFCNLALWQNAAVQLYCGKSGSCGISFADAVIDAINVFFSPQFLQVLLGLTLRIWPWWWIISSLWLVRSRAFHLLISAGSRMESLSIQIPTLSLCLVRNPNYSAAFGLSFCLVCLDRAHGHSSWAQCLCSACCTCNSKPAFGIDTITTEQISGLLSSLQVLGRCRFPEPSCQMLENTLVLPGTKLGKVRRRAS